MDDIEVFTARVHAAAQLGDSVARAVQPVAGGLTPAQLRVLAGWRGRDDQVEALLQSAAEEVDGQILASGWDPQIESVPLLVSEELVDGGWAKHFATVDGSGMVRLRTTVSSVRDGKSGELMTITWIEAEPAVGWAQRLGAVVSCSKLTISTLGSLSARSWSDLVAAVDGVPHLSNQAWQSSDPASPL